MSLTNLIINGRNLTLEQYFEFKDDFESNPEAKAQLIRDRQTHVLYQGEECEDENSSGQEDDGGSEKMEFT